MNTGAITIPSEIRQQVLAQHRDLRRMLLQIDALCRDAIGGDGTAAMALRRRVVDLESFMEAHLSFEEAHLMPLLATLDAWGDVRAREMAAEHRSQRQVLSRAGDDATSAALSGPALGELIRDLVADLFEDMKREERDMLHPDLLRDDVVSIDQSDG